MVGLTLSAFSIAVTQEKYYFGISFWICVGTIIVFVIVIIYEQVSIRKMIRQSLIQDLLNKEVESRAKKMMEVTVEMK